MLTVHNPATGAVLGTVPSLGRRRDNHRGGAAHRAFAPWRALGAAARGTILRRWFELITANREDLARLMTAEQGKPLAEARGEITYAASFIEWFAEEARRAYGDVIPGHMADKRLLVLREPVGVVAAVTPWNFPAAMITRKVGPALAAGCTVVLKPSEFTPFSALALADLAAQAGVPAGAFSVVTGEPRDIGEVFTSDPRVRKFTFTGSTRVGKMLAARCMDTVKRVSLELGGNAPFIVFDDADGGQGGRRGDGLQVPQLRADLCMRQSVVLVQSGGLRTVLTGARQPCCGTGVGDGLAGETQQGTADQPGSGGEGRATRE